MTCRYWGFSQGLLICRGKEPKYFALYLQWTCWIYNGYRFAGWYQEKLAILHILEYEETAGWWQDSEERFQKFKVLGRKGNRAKVEIALWTPLVPAAAVEPSCMHCCSSSMDLRREWMRNLFALFCFSPKEEAPVRSTEPKACVSWGLVWAHLTISGQAWSHVSKISFFPHPHIGLSNLIHSSLSSWAVIDLSVI